MKRWGMTACLLAILAMLAGSAAADEVADRERNWGFGWDSGLTLRCNFENWQVGVSAGPNDYLRNTYENRFDSDYPDSLQGLPSLEDRDRRESGFVRLHVARHLTTYRTLKFEGTLSGIYSWSDEREEYTRFFIGQDGQMHQDISLTDRFNENWHLLVGFRLSWYPVPFLSLEQEFGLAYRWNTFKNERSRLSTDDGDFYREPSEGRYQSFESYGPSSITSNVQIIVWF